MDIQIRAGANKSPELQSLADILDRKNNKLNELNDAVNSETTLKLDYTHKFNKFLLCPDLTEKVKEATGESRPNKDMKEAYIVEQLKTEHDELAIAEANTSLIRKDIELLDNLVSAMKYALQLELKR